MRRIVPLLGGVVAAMFLMSGVASAVPNTYEVTGQWVLTYEDGRPTVEPHIDDTAEVRCREDDEMTDWRVNDRRLVEDSWENHDAIFVEPDFTGKTEILRITIVCER